MSWPLVKIGNHIDILSGFAFKSSLFSDSGMPLIRIRDVLAGKTDTFYAGGYSEEYVIKKGDLLVGMDGDFNRETWNSEDALLNQRVCKLTADGQNLDQRFLYHLLPRELLKIHRNTPAVTVKHLSVKKIRDIEIPLLPLDEQKRIAAILDKADSVRRKRQQAIDLADDFLRSVFLDMFGDPVTNPKGWDVKKFGTVIDVLTDYHANGSYKTLNENVTLLDEPNYAYMVRTTDLEKKNYTDNVKYIDQHAYEHLSKTKVYGGELVINKIGSAGAVYLMPYLNRPVSLAMNQFMIRCNEHCLNEFVYYQLKTNAGVRELEKRVQGAVTKTITKDAVRDIPIILPPIKLQRQFIDVVEKINKLKTNTDNSSDLIRAKFNSISQKAFAGELQE